MIFFIEELSDGKFEVVDYFGRGFGVFDFKGDAVKEMQLLQCKYEEVF